MEKPDYRINLERLLKLYPGRTTITVKEVSETLGCCERTIRSTIKRKHNPIPAQKVGSNYIISIPSFARWLSTEV